MPPFAARQEAVEEDLVERATLMLHAGEGTVTAIVVQVLVNEAEHPVILFTLLLAGAERRSAWTAKMSTSLLDPKPAYRVVPEWDVP